MDSSSLILLGQLSNQVGMMETALENLVNLHINLIKDLELLKLAHVDLSQRFDVAQEKTKSKHVN